jgi:hypothetical protein
MLIENLAYALVQVIHNLGAVAVVGGALAGLAPPFGQAGFRRMLAWIVLFGWAVQAVSGVGFGAVSVYFYGRPPDIHAIAMTALLIKMACAAMGFGLAALSLLRATRGKTFFRETVWPVLAALGITALTAAAFLRWFA